MSMAASSVKALQSRSAALKGTARQRPVDQMTALFSVRCPPLLAQGRQAIRGTSAGQQVQLAIAVENHHTVSRPQPLSSSTPVVSFIIGGVQRNHES